MKSNYYFNCYGDYGDIALPKTYRVYFDPLCDEYKRYPVQDKLLDLAYVITHGFNVKKAIKWILENHPHVSKRNIQRALWSLTAAANHVDDASDLGNSLDTDIDIFIEDLLRYYRLPLDNSIPHFLEKDFRHVSEQTVYSCNGWEPASENVNQYQMYKKDDFVFYPGDAEQIQKYHQADIDSGKIGQIFPVGPCPEPWYGNPITAKIIILGNMPQYDDFITRCSNIVLSFEPRLMESVQSMVRNWLSLSGEGIYDDFEFGDSGITISEAYNSQTYRHWIKELNSLATEMDIPAKDLLENVCVINANAYYSVGGHDPLVAGILPSQYYLRVLINYLVNNSSVKPIFILPSSRLSKVWKKVLGYWIENDLMLSPNLILIDQPNTKLKISTSIIGKANCSKILQKII